MKYLIIFVIIIFVAIILFMIVPCFASSGKKAILPTVPKVDIEKYMGVWYEIARFPHRFEKNLVGVTATYKQNENGKISVLNQGYKYTLDGKHKTTKGRARIPDPDVPGRLQVAFFLCFWADYLILELDEHYQYALIGSSTPDYLWILCHNPQMDESTYKMLVNKAQSLGYDISKLEKVKQKTD
jgi:lipocalin